MAMKRVLQEIIQSAKQKHKVNYIYFSVLFLFLIVLNIRHFFILKPPLSLLFMVYAMGQALFEVGTFILILAFLRKRAFRWVFVALSFVACLLHFTDFTLIRLMDAPILYLFKFLFYSGFLKVLQAVNLNPSMLAITGASLIFFPLAGPLLYWLTHRWSRKRAVKCSIFQIGGALAVIVAILFSVDLLSYPFLNRPDYALLQKTLPFKRTFLPPSPQCIALTAPFAAARKESEVEAHFPYWHLEKKPNIYFFVIETLRRDFVDESTAPHMTAFADENISFADSYANSNATQVSWFSIFHSDFPHHWTAMRDTWQKGSAPLRLLKKLGYQIDVYSAADLRYFEMDKLLFGHHQEAVDRIVDFGQQPSLTSDEKDALTMQALEKDLAEQGHVYLIFLDSTHSEYSFPKDFPLKFTPIVDEIDYLTLSEKQIGPIQNRYRNAIAYIDQLVGHFLNRLKEKKLYEEALVVLTGDHGEEFFEEGALFHGTHLNRYQTHVPIFCKFPQKPAVDAATHMDLFPTLLHLLTQESDFSLLFDGQSLFAEKRWLYRIAALQNGPATPCEFLIAEKDKYLRVKFLSDKQIYQQTKLEWLDWHIPENLDPTYSLEELLHTHFAEALVPLQDKRLAKNF